MTIELPVPPTVNHAYATVRGRRVLSKEGRAYKAMVAGRLMVARWKPLDGEVSLSIDWFRARRSGDLTNRVKLLEDALKGFAWHDDSQVAEVHLRRFENPHNPGVLVTVTPR